MGKKETHYCDVCKAEGQVTQKTLQVIFTTEQTEGRSVTPYLSTEKLDICLSCLEHILKGNYLYGSGAMGYNDYVFKTRSTKS